ncbi:hypothetical protein ACQJBY_018740 [Aegilops geniculata]
MTGLRHVRARSGSGNNNSPRTISGSTNSTNLLSQKSNVNSSHPSPEKRRGRRMRATVELRVPPRGRKVGLQPKGERQFKYVPYHPKNYKYTTQLGVLLKREYPGKIEEKNDHGVITNTRPALEWYDYYHDSTLDFQQRTAADRVKEEFWNLFELHVDDEEDDSARIQIEQEANRIIDTYARKKVKDMLYQLRVDAVKLYYENQGEKLDDSMACARELEYEQYLQSRIPWCKEVAWPGLCRYWTSKEYKTNRGRGREARLKSEDIAQNRGRLDLRRRPR